MLVTERMSVDEMSDNVSEALIRFLRYAALSRLPYTGDNGLKNTAAFQKLYDNLFTFGDVGG